MNRSGLVVDDVVDPRRALLEREHGGGGRIVQVDEEGDAVAAADDRELSLAHGLDANIARQALMYSRLDLEVRPALVNGAAGRVTLRDGEVFAVTGFTVRNRRIVEMDILADLERLR